MSSQIGWPGKEKICGFSLIFSLSRYLLASYGVASRHGSVRQYLSPQGKINSWLLGNMIITTTVSVCPKRDQIYSCLGKQWMCSLSCWFLFLITSRPESGIWPSLGRRDEPDGWTCQSFQDQRPSIIWRLARRELGWTWMWQGLKVGQGRLFCKIELTILHFPGG